MYLFAVSVTEVRLHAITPRLCKSATISSIQHIEICCIVERESCEHLSL